MEMIFMNMENSEMNKPHKFVFNLLQRLDLRSSNKNKTADAVATSNSDKIVITDENLRNIEEIIIPPKKGVEILNKLIILSLKTISK